ncbi:Shedu immune nuclease family protein [Pseudomonadota bacterium]
MIEFRKVKNEVILHYTSENQSVEWVYHELEKSGQVPIAKAFKLTNKELITPISGRSLMSVDFKVAKIEGDYYCFPKSILSIEHDLYIHQDIKLERKVFVAERGISVFAKLAKISDGAIFIGGNLENAIPESVFKELLASFPNTYELNHYASARISAIVSSYINTNEDYEERYQKYLNKKVSKKGSNLKLQFSDIEILKYTSLLEKLQTMLDDEGAYTEAQWQEELLQIILLLYPKYIHVFKEAPVRDTYNNSNRNIDYLLVDSSGNTDIIEIKKPFDKCIVTKRTYRDNYIPLRELSGTVMQIEKYIFYLNKWGKKGEEKLTETYKAALPDNFEIRITNPSGIIIMGRAKGLSDAQLQDFEVIKRKYKNVIDIITYDDLIERLEFTIKQWTATKAVSTK